MADEQQLYAGPQKQEQPDPNFVQYADTPAGWAARWAAEMEDARRTLEKEWWGDADKSVRAFLMEHDGSSLFPFTTKHVPWFTSNVQQQRAILYGSVPQVTARRRFADAGDDASRVGGEILERLLNTDIEADGDSQQEALFLALTDHRMVGMANCKIRYECTYEDRQVDAMTVDLGDGRQVHSEAYSESVKTSEDACVDYPYWKDQRWSPCRTWPQVRWWAFCGYLSYAEACERFGDEIAKALPYTAANGYSDSSKASSAATTTNTYALGAKCAVWEIWSKEFRRVFWWVEGYPNILDQKDDPLGLKGFFPFPKPMFANLTSKSFMPKSDFALVKQLYEDLDTLETRESLIIDAIRVQGLYDASQDELKQLLQRGKGNQMVPVQRWAAYMEGGGLKGSVDWFPLEQLVGVLQTIREEKAAKKAELDEVTGWGSIMRGDIGPDRETAASAQQRAAAAGARMRAVQEEWARWCSEIQKIRAEIITKFFDDQTIIDRSNIARSYDSQLIPQALEVLRSELSAYRIEIQAEQIAMVDLAAMQLERTKFVQAVGNFVAQTAPFVAQQPATAPAFMEMMKWMLAPFRGSSEAESLVDQAIDAMRQAQAQAAANPPQQPPDPKVITQQMKQQADMMKAEADLRRQQAKSDADMRQTIVEGQVDQQRIQAEANAAITTQAAQTHFNLQEEIGRTRLKMEQEAARSVREASRGPEVPKP